MDKLVANFILTKVLLALLLALALPIWLPTVWLAESIETHGNHSVLAWGIRLSLLVLFLGLYWLAKRMSYHMTIEGETFVQGVKSGFRDAKLHLAFLPVVGHWFSERKDDDDVINKAPE